MNSKLGHFTLWCILLSCYASGQGIIRGKITDTNGEALIGATVSFRATTIGTATDLQGMYSLRLPDSNLHVLVVSYVGYKPVEETIRIVKNEVLVRNYILPPATSTLGEVVITAKAQKSRDGYMENIKKQTASSLDYISSETMKKTGDANVVAAVTRVPGVSTHGGFITVRGIGDRYILTTVNGMRIPTLDPFTNNIKLDLFPASLIDNVIITKTASADLPGDWAGACLSVETKDYPDQLIVNVESGFGYNSQSTFKEVVSSQHSATDWLGYDNGFRNHDLSTFVPLIPFPTLYAEFVALGLGPYFRSLGITSSWTSSSLGADTYYKLGLIQLGLLSKNDFNNASAFTAAKYAYDHGPYHAEAYRIINARAVSSNQSFPDNWRTTFQKAPIAFTQNLCFGNQFTFLKHPLGFMAGLRYASYVQYDPNAVQERANSNKSINGVPSDVDTSFLKSAREVNTWSALVNMAWKYNPNHSLSLLFMPNRMGTNSVSMGTLTGNNQSYNERQFYESRKQLIYQLKSEHYIPALKWKIEGNVSYTNGSSAAPDFKIVKVPIDTAHQNAPVVVGDRYYRFLKEKMFDSRIASEIPFGNTRDGMIRKLKFGGSFQESSRRTDQYALNLDNGPGSSLMTRNDPASDPFSSDKFGFSPVVLGSVPSLSVLRYYDYNDLPNNHAVGYSTLYSGYVMADYALTPRLRVTPGLKIERSLLHADVALYDSLHLAYGDPRRHTDQTVINNPAELDETNLLPSINMIYKLKSGEEAPVNLRVSYSRSVTRPSLRELSDISMYDYELNDQVTGSPDLKSTQINNYDARLESYFKSGDNASVSLFYKDFIHHIELANFSPYGYYWLNTPNRAWLVGMELEGKKSLTRQLELRANLTLVNSLSSFGKRYALTDGTFQSSGETVTHTMFGQAPYVVNGMLSYSFDSLGLIITVGYNRQGARLVIDGANGIPDVYELPRNLIDFKIQKKLGRHFSVSLKANDILNTSVERAYKYPQGFILDYDRYRYGTTWLLSIAYKL
ncbi:MAG TPA: carboxypeptidase-like regulatory domain-containing protein [Bacteroidia bacterium]|nr:carboxypeptidase-like regulatory domain-containing protein [Bacteroidia bacterium]